jgi:hypothetical protein
VRAAEGPEPLDDRLPAIGPGVEVMDAEVLLRAAEEAAAAVPREDRLAEGGRRGIVPLPRRHLPSLPEGDRRVLALEGIAELDRAPRARRLEGLVDPEPRPL